MKTLSLLLLLAVSTASAQTTWTNFLRQRQATTGAELQVNVANSGSRPALLPLEEGGATFQIWTQKSTTGSTPTLLSSTFVGAYKLSSTLAITSKDPYTAIPRTRVDQPFSVKATIGGLVSTATEDAARQVLFTHETKTYPAGTYVAASGQAATLFRQGYITQNGDTSFSFATTNITASNLASASGEEIFTVSALAGFKSQAETLATARVQVWPMVSLTLSGITEGTTYTTLPDLTATLSNLYPDSTTWIQVYQGPPKLGTTGTSIADSTVVIKDVVPQNRTLLLKGWNRLVTDEGQWTLEVLHTTPFGTERLKTVSFYYDNTIEVNGQIFGSE